MKKTALLIAIIACSLMSISAMAQKFPSYYPAEGFPKIGVIDVVYPDEGRIIIGDISYQVSPQAVVRSLSSKDDSLARLRAGANVGFKLSGGVITEFWLLPKNFD